MLGEVIEAAKATAALSMTGVLDPPLRIVGDEIANVVPLPKLPGLLSDSLGIGIQWIVAFQSVAQILARWGEDEGRQILANLNCSLVLGGLQDEQALDRFSALVGDTEVTEVSANLDPLTTRHRQLRHGDRTDRAASRGNPADPRREGPWSSTATLPPCW